MRYWYSQVKKWLAHIQVFIRIACVRALGPKLRDPLSDVVSVIIALNTAAHRLGSLLNYRMCLANNTLLSPFFFFLPLFFHLRHGFALSIHPPHTSVSFRPSFLFLSPLLFIDSPPFFFHYTSLYLSHESFLFIFFDSLPLVRRIIFLYQFKVQ